MRRFQVFAGVPALMLLVLAGCGGDGTVAEPAEDTLNLARDIDDTDIYIYVPADDELPPYPLDYTTAESSNEVQLRAVERANYYRWYCGLPAMDLIEGINQAAQAHCDYWILHKDKYNSTGLSPHNENPDWADGYSGDAPWDRMEFFGYGGGSSEVIAFMKDPEGSVDGWVDTLYHRIPFMDASTIACGYGQAGTGFMNAIDTMDFGKVNAAGERYTGPELVGIYPPPGATGIRTFFDGMESPEPIPPPEGWPSGTIVTITWSGSGIFAVQEHEIKDEATGEALPHVFADSTNDANLANSNTIALYPYKPLEKNKTYRVRVKGKKAGAVWEKEWTFTTQRY